MSLWLSKSVVAAVEKELDVGDGPVATASVPRLHKAMVASRPDLQVWEPETRGVGAIVVGDLSGVADWQARAEGWRHSLAPNGMLVSVGKSRASETTRKFLCSGFTNLSQVRVGRTLVTIGRRGPQEG